MINRFNFFDVYGYFIPGVTLLALLWVPFGVIGRDLPPIDVGSGLLLTLLAYVAGHLVQSLATRIFKSRIVFIIDGKQHQRHPSDRILDDSDTTFSLAMKQLLRDRIKKQYDITVTDDGSVDQTQLRKHRSDAFFLCRATLLRNNAAVYPEQFEGMYWLWRGLLACFVLAFFYDISWAVFFFASQVTSKCDPCNLLKSVPPLLFVVVAVFGAWNICRRKIDRDWFWVAVGLVIVFGASSAVQGAHEFSRTKGASTITEMPSLLFLMLGISCLLPAYLASRAHQAFAKSFAESVYGHFLAWAKDIEARPANTDS